MIEAKRCTNLVAMVPAVELKVVVAGRRSVPEHRTIRAKSSDSERSVTVRH